MDGIPVVVKREGRAKRSIRAFFFPSLNGEFRTIINGWDSGKGIHQNMDNGIVIPVLKLLNYSLHIVIVGKIIQLHVVVVTAAHVIQSFYGVGNFEKVMVVAAGPKCLIQVIVGDRMQHLCIDPAVILSVNDFSHQPEVRFYFVGDMTHSLHEIKVQYIRSIQSDAINVKFRDPETNDIV